MSPVQAIDAGYTMVLSKIENTERLSPVRNALLQIKNANIFAKIKIDNILDHDMIEAYKFVPNMCTF